METVTTKKFRVSYPNVFKPTNFAGQDPKYGVTMLFDKSVDLAELRALAKKAVEKKWPDAAIRAKVLGNPKFKNPFRDGDTEKPDTEGYKNVVFIRANSKMKPGLVDRNVQPIIAEDEFYAGCYARATLTAYGYDMAGNIGVAFGLQNLQKLEDGEPFSGRKAAEEEFEVMEDGVPQGAAAAPTVAGAPKTAMFD